MAAPTPDPDISSILDSLRLQGTGPSAPVHRTIRPSSAPQDDQGDLEPTVPPGGAPLARPDRLTPDELPLLIGGEPDAFVLGGMLGKGGAGFVQVAWQTSLEREVAVKRIRQRPPGATLVAGLVEEARLSGSLEHPNIIPVHDLGRAANGEPLLVMKRVEGVTWDTLLAEPDHPAWRGWRGDRLDRHLQILVQVCRALEFAHDRGVAHLDVKPSNVMIGEYGETWLMDWGVATRVDERDGIPTTQIVGTPAFMAPEMVLGRASAERRSDVFLLGAVLHHVLTGRYRYSGDRLEAVLMQAVMCEPVQYDPSVPAGLAAIAQRACCKAIEDRYRSVGEVRMAVEDFLEHRGAQRLIDAAQAQLAEMTRVIEASAGDPAALARSAEQISAVATQARFGFEQALSQWPGQPEATAGLQQVLEGAIGFELLRGNVGAVAPLIEALPSPVPELSARYEELRAELAAELDARAKLETLRSEQRFEAGDWSRSVGMLVNGTAWSIGMLVWGWALRVGHIEDAEGFNLLVAAFGTTVSLGVVFLLRGLFLDNQIRRGFTAAYCAFIVALDLNRVAGLFMDIPFEHTFMADHAVLILFMGVLAAFVAPTLWWAAGVAGVGMLATAMWPGAMFGIGALELLVVNCIVGWALRPRSAGGKFA